MNQIIGPQEQGLTYRLDLQEGSELHTPTPTGAATHLPICICSYGYFVAGPGHYTEREAVRTLQQVFITHKGCGRFIIDGSQYFSTPGTAVLLDFSHPHRYEAYGGSWEHEWVNFSGDACTIYHQLINAGGFCVHPLEGSLEPQAIMREIRAGIMLQDMPGLVQTCTRVIRLLDCLYTLSVTRQRTHLDELRGNVMRSVEYIQEHYMDRLNLETLSQAAYLSKYYYAHAFKQYMGMTPYEYVNSVRLSHAKSLLVTTSHSVEDIGWLTGFNGSKNFIRQFRQTLGITPGEYRKYPGA